MKYAGAIVYEARHLIFNRHSRAKVGGREMMLRLANKPSPPEDDLSLQVIVKSHDAPWSQRISLVNFRQGDFKNESTLSKALQNGQERAGLAMIPEVLVQVSIWNGLVRYYKD
jgi:hypothetical protein